MSAIPSTEAATISDLAAADYQPVILARVSTSKQRKGLPVQVESMKAKVLAAGFKLEPVVFEEQQSGKAADLRTIKALKEYIEDNGSRPIAVFVRDVPRFGRGQETNLRTIRRLKAQGVPVIPLDMNRPVGANGTPEGDMVFGILSAVAESAKSSEEAAQREGQKRAEERGLLSGEPIELWPDKFRRGKSFHQRVWDTMPAFENKTISQSAFAEKEGVYQQMVKKAKDALTRANDAGKIREFLEVIDAIIKQEKRRHVKPRNIKPATKRTNLGRALHRVTNSYLRDPANWPRPDTVGNPNIASRPEDRGLATGTIADAIENPHYYQPPKK
jgi:DNA invertase Pin-like site-specific DNA recombinase